MKTSESASASPLRWVPTVYFAMGLPNVVLTLVSVIMFSELGISEARVTFWTGLLGMPWAFKPLWSPFLEMFGTKKYFVAGTQMITGLSFALVALCLPLPGFFTFTIALMTLIAFSGATHDIAVDGVYMSELDTRTQARYIGWQGAFYNIAKVVANGGLVYAAGVMKDRIGIQHTWIIVMGAVGVMMAALSLYNSRAIPAGETPAAGIRSFRDGWNSFTEVFRTFFVKKHIMYYMVFIILYRLAEGLAIKILPLFLKAPPDAGGLGLEVKQIGIIVGTLGTVAFISGSILAGLFIARRGLRKNLFLLCCALNLPFLLYLGLAVFQPSDVWLIGTAVVCEYFGYGFGTVGLTLFMMQQVAPGRHKMAHYAFASGVMLLGYNLAGMMSGWLAGIAGGYGHFFVIVAFAMIPVLILSRIIPFTHPDSNE